MSNSGFSRDSGIDNTRLQYDIIRAENKKLKNKERAKWFFRKNYVYRTIRVECQLFRGEDKFPRKEFMSLTELGQKNREFVLKNIKMEDNGKESPLYKWLAIDRDGLDSLVRRNMDKSITLDYANNELI